jgi:hypothetical protein
MKVDEYPLVSIVMLNYNGLNYLKRTIPPLLELDYPNYEFIIVDNGSTDGSIEFIKGFNEIKLIKSPILREKNFACNYAVKKAKGEYIFLCDNDLLIKNNQIISDLVNDYNSLEGTGSLTVAFVNEGENTTKGYGSFLGFYFIKETKYLDVETVKKLRHVKIGYPSGIGIFISKRKWNEVGGYDSHLKFGGDDNDLGIKLWLMGYNNYLYSKTLQVHIGMVERADNKKYSLKWKEMFYAHLYTITKNYSFSNMLLALFCYSLFAFLKSIKQSVQRLHIGPFLAFFQGYYLFFKNLRVAIKKRKIIQSKRVIKDDVFLKIKPPNFD